MLREGSVVFCQSRARLRNGHSSGLHRGIGACQRRDWEGMEQQGSKAPGYGRDILWP